MEKINGNITKHLIADFGTFQLYREDFERAIDQACQISIHAPTRGATAILHKKFVYFYTIPTINI